MRFLPILIGAWGIAMAQGVAQVPAWRTAPLPPEAERLNRTAEAAASFDTAARLYAQSLRLCATNGPALHGFGLALLEQGRATDALKIFHHMDELFPDDASIHILLAHATARLAAPRRADIHHGLAAVQRALELQPDNPEAWHAQSILLHLDGDYAEASEAARQSLALDARYPSDPDTTARYQQQEIACHDARLVFSPLD